MSLTPRQAKGISILCVSVSVTSALATPFLVIKANNEAADIIERDDLMNAPFRERMNATWKCYIPVGIVMALGLGASGGHGVLTHKVSSSLASEIASHALTIASNNHVKEAILNGVKEKYGLDVEKEMRDIGSAAMTKRNDAEVTRVIDTGAIVQRGNKCLLCDDTHKRYFYGSLEDVKAAVNTINCAINLGKDDICLADIYLELDARGIEPGDIDWMLAPKAGELFELKISTSIYDGETCTHFSFVELVVPPK